jgi:hypothetical protein
MNQLPCILSTSYWPPISYIALFVYYENIKIENWETYSKQTYRNRCEIYGPNSIQVLTVPVVRGSLHKVKIADLRIDYEIKWQKNHIKSIEAAYRSSPFYDFYMDDLIPIYERKYSFLLELNEDILGIVNRWLSNKIKFEKTTSYEPIGNFMDYRNSIHPKANSNINSEYFIPVNYTQGFEQRHGFVPNLSILDLIFNTGPESIAILNQSISITK